MACSHPDQDRYLMISLTLPRAKPSTSRAGQPPAAIPHTPIACLNPRSRRFFAVLPGCSRLAAHSHHTRIAPYAVFSCDLGDRRRDSIPIVLAAAAGARLPRFRALALFGRLPLAYVVRVVIQASENLHIRCHWQIAPVLNPRSMRCFENTRHVEASQVKAVGIAVAVTK